jgi:hypothetical protein
MIQKGRNAQIIRSLIPLSIRFEPMLPLRGTLTIAWHDSDYSLALKVTSGTLNRRPLINTLKKRAGSRRDRAYPPRQLGAIPYNLTLYRA